MRRVGCLTVLVVGCWLVPGVSWDFQIDAVTAWAFLNGQDPYLPGTAYGLAHDVVTFRTPLGLGLTAPLGLLPLDHLRIAGLLFVAVSGWVFIRVAELPWWTAALIVVPPFMYVDFHGKWTFWLAVALIGVWRLIDRPVWSGLLLALAVGFQLWPGIVAVGLWVAGKRRVVWWTAGWFVGLNGLMLLISASLTGMWVALTQDPFWGETWNWSPMRWLPWWTIPIGVIGFAWWGWGRDWQRVFAWSIPVGLALSPVVWSASLPVLVVSLIVQTDRSDSVIRRYSHVATEGKV